MKFAIVVGFLFLTTLSAEAGTHTETFDDGELGAWQEIVQHNDNPGSWDIIDNELQAISHGGFTRLLTLGDETWKDYVIVFDVKPLEKHGPGNLAIAARIEGTWAIWCVIGDLAFPAPVPQSRATCFGGNLHEDQALLLGSELHPLLRVKKWAQLKLSVQGAHFTFWINGKQVLDGKLPELENAPELAAFPDFSRGGCGVGLSNHTARFDNVTITGEGIPDEGGLSVTPRANIATTWGSLKEGGS